MSGESMAATFRDVLQAQKEETGLLGDLSSIIDAMKTLSCDRGANVEQLAQAHYDEIEQLKRTHAYQMEELRTESDRLLMNAANQHWAKSAEIDRLTKSLSAKDQEIAQLRSNLAGKSDELDTARNSTVELQRQLTHLKFPAIAAHERAKEIRHRPAISKDAFTSDGTQEAIIRLTNQEIRTHTAAKDASQVAAESEQRRLRAFISTVNDNHAAMRDELNYIRHEITQIAARFGKHKRSFVSDIDEMVGWWDTFMDELSQTTGEMLEAIATKDCSYTRERDGRIDALIELSKVCGVRERLGLKRWTGHLVSEWT